MVLLACFAHPDDEAFSCGGLLALAAEAGWETHVACATYAAEHERGMELQASCDLLDVARVHHFDLADGQLQQQRTMLSQKLDFLLRAVAPTVVVTMGPDGAYGHLDHVVLSEEVTAKAENVLHVVYPDGLFDGVRRSLEKTPVPLAPPVAQQTIHARALISSVADRKLKALAAHRSQLPGGDPQRFLQPNLIDALLNDECFHLAKGEMPSGLFDA